MAQQQSDPWAIIKTVPVTAPKDDPWAIVGTTQTPERVSLAKAKMDTPTTITEYIKGLVKSGAGVVETGGQALRAIPGVNTLSSMLPEATLPLSTKPSNSAQAWGKGTGDVAQFLIPGAGEARAANVVKDMGLTALQGGGAGSVLASGALSAIPMGKAVTSLAGTLKGSAETTTSRALGATGMEAREKAVELAPEMLKRGVSGSREGMLATATPKVQEIGQKIGAEIKRAAAAGETVDAHDIRHIMGQTMPKLIVADKNGNFVTIPGMEATVKALGKLDQFVESLGTKIPVDRAEQLKIAFDKIVYGTSELAGSTDKAKAAAYEASSNAFRKLLAKNTTIDALNKEFSFWKGLEDVLSTAVTKEKTNAAPGLLSKMTHAGSAVVGGTIGGAAGGGPGAVAGVTLTPMLMKLIETPYWRTTVTAPMKNSLADALASGNAQRIAGISRAVLASVPSQIRQQLEGK